MFQLVRTRGGAVAMYSATAHEVMHPGVGPLLEAEHLYVRQSRLRERLRAAGEARGPGDAARALVVFDVGLGAGSNALAALAAAETDTGEASAGGVVGARLEIVSFERELGALRLALEHAAAFGLDGAAGDAARALLARGRHEGPRATWRLVPGDLPGTLAAAGARADVVFWDPYSPHVNPELWTVAAFTAAREAAAAGCALYTYSASTATRLALLAAGWAVGVGDATGSKAHTTAAALSVADLARPLDRRWLRRLRRPDAPLPADAPADLLARVAAAPQFAE
jgi:queuine tRNA-ribosyltransferase